MIVVRDRRAEARVHTGGVVAAPVFARVAPRQLATPRDHPAPGRRSRSRGADAAPPAVEPPSCPRRRAPPPARALSAAPALRRARRVRVQPAPRDRRRAHPPPADGSLAVAVRAERSATACCCPTSPVSRRGGDAASPRARPARRGVGRRQRRRAGAAAGHHPGGGQRASCASSSARRGRATRREPHRAEAAADMRLSRLARALPPQQRAVRRVAGRRRQSGRCAASLRLARRGARRRCSSRCAAATPTATTICAQALDARRGGARSSRTLPRRRSRSAPRAPSSCPTRAARSRRSRRVLRPPGRRARARRRHRHERQDQHDLPGRVDPRAPPDAQVGLIGTVEVRYARRARARASTRRPRASTSSARCATMRTRGIDAVVMEVSSHGARRSAASTGCRFAVAAFTNLTQDHLDYPRRHGGATARRSSRCSASTWPRRGSAVVNVDDPSGRRVRGRGGERRRAVIRVSRDATRRRRGAPARAAEIVAHGIARAARAARRGALEVAAAAARRLQPREPARRGRHRRGARRRRPARSRGRRRAAAQVPGRVERVAVGADGPTRARRLRAHARRGREAAARRCGRCAAGGSIACSAAAATATAASARGWREAVARYADRAVADQRQPAHRGSARRSSTTSSAGSPGSRASHPRRSSGSQLCARSPTAARAIARALAIAAPERHRGDRRQGPRGLPDRRPRAAALRRPRRGAPRAARAQAEAR